MKEFYDLDEGTKQDEKRCAICGLIRKKENMSFKKTINGPVITIDGKVYQIPCWVCGDVEHDDGCLDCPVCHSVVIDASPEALRSAEQSHEPIYALPESGVPVYTFPPQKGDTYQTP